MGNAGSERQPRSRGELGRGGRTVLRGLEHRGLLPGQPWNPVLGEVGISRAPTVSPGAQVREEGERGLGAPGWLPHLREGPDCRFPPSALQARNCSTKPSFSRGHPIRGWPGDASGTRSGSLAPRLLPTCNFLWVGEIRT